MASEAAATVLPPIAWHASPNRSSRRGTAVTHLVWHATAGAYAPSWHWLCTPTVLNADGSVKSGPDASCHLMLDELGDECAQLVPLSEKAWHASGWNPFSVGVEHASIGRGFASHEQLRKSARAFAWLCHHYGIPPLFGLHRPRGIVRHRDLGAAGGNHSDGPTDLVWFREYLPAIARELAAGGFRKTWPRL